MKSCSILQFPHASRGPV